MTALAIPLADRSSLVFALVGVSFLLTVKSLPRVEWLHAALGAWAVACYWRWLDQLAWLQLMEVALAAAFVVWRLGVLVQRYKPHLCRAIGLESLGYEFPLFHAAIALGFLSLLIRIGLSSGWGASYAAYAWFPLGLSVLSLFMLRAYPRRECVHASLAFLTWGVGTIFVPSLKFSQVSP